MPTAGTIGWLLTKVADILDLPPDMYPDTGARPQPMPRK